MGIAIITGSAGLIGSEAARFFHEKGLDIVGIDNDMRKYFFGEDGSNAHNRNELTASLPRYTHENIDIRDRANINTIFRKFGGDIKIVIHTAAQPSHDWAAKEPITDFEINALGTLNLLEATRIYSPNATFIFTSTNKVYGDMPNSLPFCERESRWEIDQSHPYYSYGIDESMSIDQSKHSIFGASKVSADVMVQEYGRYFGIKSAAFRGGCLTGPAHSGVELHGFLSYLVKCAIHEKPYTIHGYKGKQVRDNIHSNDLVSCFWCFFQNPRYSEVYNMGGSRHSNCSILEAISIVRQSTGKELIYSYSDKARSGDHIWWISDVRKFQSHYPEWKYQYDMNAILKEIIEATLEQRVD